VPTPLRFLEVGVESLFKKAFPQQTDFYYTGTRHHSWYGRECRPLTPAALWGVMQRLRRQEYDLIAVHPALYAAWHPRSFLNMFKYRQLSYATGLFSSFAFQFLRFVRHTPMVVTDLVDSFSVGRHNFFLFDRCEAYYKRELPQDNWQVFFGSGHRNLPGRSFRKKRRFQRYVEKLRPIGLGVTQQTAVVARRMGEVPKTTDVFFVGSTGNWSTVRSKGIDQIKALRDKGLRVDIPEQRLPYEEFMRRCAQAWLVWSPAGFGWECYRHYEVALAGSVPVMNLPTIERHQPLEHGKHCFLYSIEGDNLTTTILDALSNKPRLVEMAAAARAQAERYHTCQGLCEHILREVLPEKAPAAATSAWETGGAVDPCRPVLTMV
jgi:hypothetical protein